MKTIKVSVEIKGLKLTFKNDDVFLGDKEITHHFSLASDPISPSIRLNAIRAVCEDIKSRTFDIAGMTYGECFETVNALHSLLKFLRRARENALGGTHYKAVARELSTINEAFSAHFESVAKRKFTVAEALAINSLITETCPHVSCREITDYRRVEDLEKLAKEINELEQFDFDHLTKACKKESLEKIEDTKHAIGIAKAVIAEAGDEGVLVGYGSHKITSRIKHANEGKDDWLASRIVWDKIHSLKEKGVEAAPKPEKKPSAVDRALEKDADERTEEEKVRVFKATKLATDLTELSYESVVLLCGNEGKGVTEALFNCFDTVCRILTANPDASDWETKRLLEDLLERHYGEPSEEWKRNRIKERICNVTLVNRFPRLFDEEEIKIAFREYPKNETEPSEALLAALVGKKHRFEISNKITRHFLKTATRLEKIKVLSSVECRKDLPESAAEYDCVPWDILREVVVGYRGEILDWADRIEKENDMELMIECCESTIEHGYSEYRFIDKLDFDTKFKFFDLRQTPRIDQMNFTEGELWHLRVLAFSDTNFVHLQDQFPNRDINHVLTFIDEPIVVVHDYNKYQDEEDVDFRIINPKDLTAESIVKILKFGKLEQRESRCSYYWGESSSAIRECAKKLTRAQFVDAFGECNDNAFYLMKYRPVDFVDLLTVQEIITISKRDKELLRFVLNDDARSEDEKQQIVRAIITNEKEAHDYVGELRSNAAKYFYKDICDRLEK